MRKGIAKKTMRQQVEKKESFMSSEESIYCATRHYRRS